MSAIIRTCGQTLTRQTRVSVSCQTLSTSSIARKDFVQELYLKELKNYKPSAAASSTGQVRDFSMPTSASLQVPYIPAAQDVASELSSWQSVPVYDNVNATASSETVSEHASVQSADDFLNFLERDHPPQEAHH